MKNVLITGASGNVGLEIIRSLENLNHNLSILAGVRDVQKDKKLLSEYKVKLVHFDFMDNSTYTSLIGCDILFLLRPPQISDTEKYFKPLILFAKEHKVRHIVFLSVQGVEKSSIIPHHKIEKMILESAIPHTFLRPAYFMQNFITTLHQDIVQKNIFLPAGKAKFTLVDVRDIGKVGAIVITQTQTYLNLAYDLTCNERLTFQEMADKLSVGLGEKISFESPNLFRFFLRKRKENVAVGYILVLIMLHYLPRFQETPSISSWIEKITGQKPIEFNEFIHDYKTELIKF